MTFNHTRKMRLRFDGYISEKVVSGFKTKQLILDHRLIALRMVNALFRRWSIRISEDDRQSIADLGLCEASMRFREDKGTQFTSYLFFYIKSEVLKLIRVLAKTENYFLSERGQSLSAILETEAPYLLSSMGSSCPESICVNQELKEQCKRAFKKLSKLERMVIRHLYLHGWHVASTAQYLGYSRGHISEIKQTALRKLRRALITFR